MVNEENQNFERGEDPKKSMEIGQNRFKDFNEVFKYLAEEKEINLDDFWDTFRSTLRDSDGVVVSVELFDALIHTPIEYQIEWAKEKFQWYLELIGGEEYYS